MAHAMVVLNAIRQKQLRRLLADFPPWRDSPTGWFAVAEFREQLVRVVEDVALLLQRHGVGVLVAVAV